MEFAHFLKACVTSSTHAKEEAVGVGKGGGEKGKDELPALEYVNVEGRIIDRNSSESNGAT